MDIDDDGCEEACDCCNFAIKCAKGFMPFDINGDGCPEQCCAILQGYQGCGCQPTAGGPYWIEETQSVGFKITCASGLQLPGSAFSIPNKPSGANYSNANFAWTTGLGDAGVYNLNLVVTATGETGQVRVGVADMRGTPAMPVASGNVVVSVPSATQCLPTWTPPTNFYTHEYGLPVFFLYPLPQTSVDAPATLVYGNHCYNVKAHVHGAFSANFPQKSYTVQFADNDLFNDPAHGFANKKRIILVQSFDDPTGMRPRLAADLWNALDPTHLQVQSYSAVLFQGSSPTNVAYWGLYTVLDHYKKRFLHAQGAWPVLSNNFQGNLYKAGVYGDLSFPANHSQYEVIEGAGWSDLDALIAFIDPSNTAQPAFDTGIVSRIDFREYVDIWILTTFLRMDDSATHNMYHYHQVQPAHLWRPVPWDFNLSAGQGPLTEHLPATVTVEYSSTAPGAGTTCWGFHFWNRLFNRLLSGNWRPAMEVRYAQQLAGPLEKCSLLRRIDAFEAEIGLESIRDQAMWGATAHAYFLSYCASASNLTHAQEVTSMKQWLVDRWDYQHALYP